MNDSHDKPFVITDASATKRFPSAVIASLAINILFLIGASTLIREPPPSMPSSAETGYITLERLESEPVLPSRKPVIPSANPIPHPVRLISPKREPTPIVTSNPVPKIATSSSAEDSPSTTQPESPEPEATIEKPQEIPASDPDTGKDATGNVESDVAASNLAAGSSAEVPAESSVTTPSPAIESGPVPQESSSPAASEPTGVTKAAESSYQEIPRMPDTLLDSGYRSFVRVEVEVAEAGNFTVKIRTSSGNPDIDARVLDSLKRWKWKPALKNGVPITSTQIFQIDFAVD